MKHQISPTKLMKKISLKLKAFLPKLRFSKLGISKTEKLV